MDPSDLVFSSAHEAADAIRRGAVSSLALMECILDRIDRFNPALNAVVTLMREEALVCALEADEALARGELWGPLHGVLVTVKDCLTRIYDKYGIEATGQGVLVRVKDLEGGVHPNRKSGLLIFHHLTPIFKQSLPLSEGVSGSGKRDRSNS